MGQIKLCYKTLKYKYFNKKFYTFSFNKLNFRAKKGKISGIKYAPGLKKLSPLDKGFWGKMDDFSF